MPLESLNLDGLLIDSCVVYNNSAWIRRIYKAKSTQT